MEWLPIKVLLVQVDTVDEQHFLGPSTGTILPQGALCT